MEQKVCIGLIISMMIWIATQSVQAQDSAIVKQIFQSNTNDKIIFDIEALYFKPDNIHDKFDESKGFLLFDFPTQFSWGFDLIGDLGCCHNQDRKIEWIHYRNHLIQGTLPINNLKGEGATHIPYSYHSDFDILYLEIGKWINIKDNVFLRLQGGLEYANMQVGYDFNYTTNTTRSTQTYQNDYVYHSIGPRMGLELDFLFGHSLTLVLQESAAILKRIGTHDLTVHQINRDPGQQTRSDIEEHNRLQGVQLSTDVNILLQYNQHAPSGDVHYFGGIRGIIFLNDLLNWGGAILGVKWTGTL